MTAHKISLETVLQDFRSISEKAFAVKEKRDRAHDDPDRALSFEFALMDLDFFPKDKIVWYGGKEGFMPEKSIGKPEDYLSIRDNYKALKEFIGKNLDRGKVHAGGGTHADTSRETNTADYVIWLYQHSENNSFKKNVEMAVTELLNIEVKKNFEPYDIQSALNGATRKFQNGYEKGDVTKLFYDQDIGTTRWRYGLDHPETKDEKKFREWFDQELEPTVRESPKRRNEKTTHFAETSTEFKEAFKQRYLQQEAHKAATEKFTPQFNRLMGLLEVIYTVGEKDNGFSAAKEILKSKARSGFFKDAHDLAYHYSSGNIYNHLLAALSSVQNDTSLHEFWLDQIGQDANIHRLLTAAHGLLNVYAKEERKEHLPAILARISQRGYDLDHKEYHHKVGFIFDENVLDQFLEHIAALTFDKETFFHLDKEQAMLSFLTDMKIEVGKYHFNFESYTPNGPLTHHATYDLKKNTISGDTGSNTGINIESAIRSYFVNGFELPNQVTVTSLEGKKVGSETKIVEGQLQEGDFYEGIIGLNNSHFPFLYDNNSSKVLLGKPLQSSFIGFGRRGDWETSRLGVDKIKEKISYDALCTLSKIGEEVNGLIKEKKKQGLLGDSLYALKDVLGDDLAPYISCLIQAKLVNGEEGLWP